MNIVECGICKSRDAGIMLKCYVCSVNIHATCAKVSDSTANELCEENGLHFYCAAHRSISVSALLKTICRLQSFHVELKMLTDQYKDVLELTSVSELRKLEALYKKIVPNTNTRALRSSTKRQQESSLASNKRAKKNQRNILPTDSDKVESSSPCSRIQNNINGSNEILTSAVSAVNEITVEKPSNTNENEFGFSAVPPPKKIFVSRLPPDISVDVIRNHVESRLGRSDVFLDIIRLPTRDGSLYSSMILNVGHNLDVFSKVVNESFWPRHTIVHEDIPREQRNKSAWKQSKNQKTSPAFTIM